MTDQPPYAGGPGGQQPWGQQQPQGQQFGNMPSYSGGYTQPQGNNGLAVAALVLGILSIPGALIVWGGLIFGVLAVIFGFIGLSKSKKVGKGKGMAIAGLITGFVGLIIAVILLIIASRELAKCKDQLGPGATQSQLSQCVSTNVSR